VRRDRVRRVQEPLKLLRGLGEFVVAAPLFVTAPLHRRGHLRWGATDDELLAEMPGDRTLTRADSTWAWKLTPLPGERTRLVTRLKAKYEWSSPVAALLTLVLLEVADFPMMRKMLRGLKERAEREPVAPVRFGTPVGLW